MVSSPAVVLHDDEAWKQRVWYVFVATVLCACAYFARNLQWSVLWDYRGMLLAGLGISWLYSIIAIVVGMAVGTALAACRIYAIAPVRVAAAAVVETIRATPHLMIFLWVFFVAPEVTHRSLDPGWAAVIALTLIATAYLSEVMRAGILSVDRYQPESAYATGLNRMAILWYVVLPQAFRNMIPALVATVVMLFKTTSLMYVIGVIDFFGAIQIVKNVALVPFVVYAAAAIVYYVCSYALSSVVKRLDANYVLTQ